MLNKRYQYDRNRGIETCMAEFFTALAIIVGFSFLLIAVSA